MKKKNKVENSLERLFSAKKSDLVSNEPAAEETPAEEKPAEKNKKPQAQSAKSTKKEVKQSSAPKKDKKKAEDEQAPVLSEQKIDLPVKEMKQTEPEPQVVSTPQTASKEETPTDQKKMSEKQQTKSQNDNAIIDKPMTEAIVAKKANEYDADEHLVIFSLADQAYGISIMIVESIIKMQDITHVPRAHPAIKGATNLRGVVLPVIDLCKKMGLQAADDVDAKRIIVVAAEDVTAGFIVDNVQSVFRIPAKEIAPPSPMVTTIDQKYIKGIAKNGEHGLVIILEPISIFESIITESADISQKKRLK